MVIIKIEDSRLVVDSYKYRKKLKHLMNIQNTQWRRNSEVPMGTDFPYLRYRFDVFVCQFSEFTSLIRYWRKCIFIFILTPRIS